MRRIWVTTAFLLALSVFASLVPQASAGLEEQTLVLYNASDPLSRELAQFYAEKRKIPERQVVGLACASTEEISREEFETTIARPLRGLFDDNDWWKTVPHYGGAFPEVVENKIRFIALIRGIPLKIRASSLLPAAASVPGPAQAAKTNEASVDSELAALGFFDFTPWGMLSNPFYRSYTGISDAMVPQLMLVTRLDGPFGSSVKRMIEDGMAVEKNGLWGRGYFDLHQGAKDLPEKALAVGNQWIEKAAQYSRRNGIPVVVDHTPKLFGPGYPLRDPILYYGWYREHATGPFASGSQKFVPGAIAIHIHSFSGQTVRDPLRGWVAPLIERGVAGTLGNVYEPYLAFTPQIDVFNERLLAGFTLAESSYMSLLAVSWMTTVVGDPLYRPFSKWHEIPVPGAPQPPLNDWERFRQAVLDSRHTASSEPIDALTKDATKTGNARLIECLGLYEAGSNEAAALRLLRLARQTWESLADKAAVALEEVDLMRMLDRKDRAVELAREYAEKLPEGELKNLFKDLQLELDPPPKPVPSAVPPPK